LSEICYARGEEIESVSPSRPLGVKAGAVAADVERVAFLGPVGMLAAGVNDGDSTLKDFLELEGKKRLAKVES
jgi:hypothetical protein